MPLVERWKQSGHNAMRFSLEDLEELHALLPRDSRVLEELIARLEGSLAQRNDPAIEQRLERYREELAALQGSSHETEPVNPKPDVRNPETAQPPPLPE